MARKWLKQLYIARKNVFDLNVESSQFLGDQTQSPMSSVVKLSELTSIMENPNRSNATAGSLSWTWL